VTLVDQNKTDKGNKAVSTTENVDKTSYIDYYEALRKYLSRRLNSKEDVDDAVQEVYLRAIQNHNPEFKPSASFLYKIASNLLKDHVRKIHSRKLNAHIPIEYADLISESGSPEQMLRSKQGVSAIKKIFRSLDPTYRRVFLLNRVKGLTYDEIADEMGITKSQVKNNIYHVLIQIRKIIGEYL